MPGEVAISVGLPFGSGDLKDAKPSVISRSKRTELSKSSTLTPHCLRQKISEKVLAGLDGLLKPVKFFISSRGADDHRQRGIRDEERESMLFGSETEVRDEPALYREGSVLLFLDQIKREKGVW